MRTAALALALTSATTAAMAQASDDYPNKPIRFISTGAPGTASDLLARLLAERMGPMLKGNIIVDNKPGAGGLIAVDLAAKAPPDGYTFTMGGATTHVIMPSIRPNMPYNALKDFVYMGQVATSPGVLVVAADFPANNLQELIALAKTRTDLQYASWGNGSTGHFCGEMLNRKAGIKMQHIPYKSVAQIQTDLYGGHVKIAQVDGGSAPAMVKSGKVKAITTCTGRHISFPNVRSYQDEKISDGEKKIGQFRFGLHAPAGSPKAITDKIEAALKATLEMPDVKTKIQDWGLQPAYLPGDVVLEMTVREIEQWRRVAEGSNIKLD